MNIVAYIRGLPANEPVVLGSVVSSVMTTAIAFGIHLTGPQVTGVAATVTVVAAFIIRLFASPAYPVSTQKEPSQ